MRFRYFSYPAPGYREFNRFFVYLKEYLLNLAMSNKWIAVFFGIVFPLLVVFTGIDDKTAINLYINELQILSEHRIKREQKLRVTAFYCKNPDKKPSLKRRRKVRRKFESQKRKIKQEWEGKYSKKWPVMSSTIKTQAYEAHHIIPINAGGVNAWWNISPLHSKKHTILHESVEEKACFSHNIIQKKLMRFILRVKMIFRLLTIKKRTIAKKTKS